MLKRVARIAVNRLRDLHRRVQFERALRRFVRDPRRAVEKDDDCLSTLVRAWGNTAWSGQPEFLRACVLEALEGDGPILECGSGLSTLLIGIVAQSRGRRVWSLEHLPSWAQRVQGVLDAHAIRAVSLCASPLRDYGDFDWYAAAWETMPAQFSLVVCDGPPSATRGGRYGLGPVMASRMAPGCKILLDDAERRDEQAVASRWAKELSAQVGLRGDHKPFFWIERRA